MHSSPTARANVAIRRPQMLAGVDDCLTLASIQRASPATKDLQRHPAALGPS
jgi:hypothetical protein